MHPAPHLTLSSGNPKRWKRLSSFSKHHIWAQRGRSLTQGHTAIRRSPRRGATRTTRSRGASLLQGPLGEELAQPLLLPAPEGRPGGRAEEVSTAGRNAFGRGAPARSGGDSWAGSRGGGRGRAEGARCLTSPWCRWTGRGAATMTTSRGSVGWTTGSARSGMTLTVRARPDGALAGTGRGADRTTRARAHADTWPDRAHVGAGPTFLSLRRRRRQSLAPRAQTRSSWAPARPLSGRPPHPSSSLAGRGRGLQTWPTKEARPLEPLSA